MSVIVEAVDDGQILVLAKGADTAMGPRLRPGQVFHYFDLLIPFHSLVFEFIYF